MQEVFEKILKKLNYAKEHNEPKINNKTTQRDRDVYSVSMEYAIDIVKQVAEEYNNGWIPCSVLLPEESLNDVIGWDAYRERCCFVHYIGGRFILGDDTESVKITHWMPTPYQPKGE